jgi:membrane-associated phospholipid phosphatase
VSLRLPAFDPGRKTVSLVVAYAFWCLLYVGSGHLRLRAPVDLPLLAPDRMPAINWTIWVYLSHLLFVPLALVGLREPEVFDRTLKSILLATAASGTCFVLFPTALPGASSPRSFAFDAVAATFDLMNTNCFPSLHVALAFLAASAYLEERRPLAAPAFAWAAAIAVSTVTAKQHYFVDVPGGLLLAWASREIVRSPAPWPTPFSEFDSAANKTGS